MSKIFKLRTRPEIDEEAAVWVWRMDSDAVSAADQDAFESWLRRDSRHRRAYEELTHVWTGLNGLAEAKREEKIATFTRPSAGFPLAGRNAWWAAAAAALVVGVAVAAWMQRGSELRTFATAVGQERNVTLADGSVVSLNTNTIVETNLRRKVREIYLRKGEAHFQVAHDRSRPFLVHAGDAVVRAVGTQFEVRIRSDQHVDVVVNEGSVEVRSEVAAEPAGAAHAARVMRRSLVHTLGAGQQLSATGNDYSVVPVSTHRLSSVLAWRDGAVVFDGEPLSDAIAEIGRYTDARIIVNDSQVAALRVGGRYRTGDVQAFFDALQTAFPVTIHRGSNGEVFIDPRP
jgi:transmembrane sensor